MKMACRKVNQRMFMLLCRLPCGNQMQAARFPQFRSCRGRGARRGVFAIPQEILDVRNEQAFLARDIPHRNSELVPLVIDLFLCLRCEGQYVATQKPFGWNRMADFAACLLAHRSDTRHVRHVRLRFYAADFLLLLLLLLLLLPPPVTYRKPSMTRSRMVVSRCAALMRRSRSSSAGILFTFKVPRDSEVSAEISVVPSCGTVPISYL